MQIQILSTQINQATTKTGKPYEVVEVAYKNLSFQGKVEGRKIMPFGATAASHSVLKAATTGQVYDITVTKGESGYNDWTSATLSTGAAPAATPAFASQGAVAKTQPGQTRSTYETPEERAQRQVYIIRQSSVDRALQYHSVGAKTPPNLNEVFDTAQKIADFVFQVKDAGPTGFDDLPDFDVPTVE